MAAFLHPRAELEQPAHLAQESSPHPLLHSSRRIPALDGLRGIAVGLVLLYHSVISGPVPKSFQFMEFSARLGWSGVDLFFVLSGFLIGGILLDVRDSPNYFKTFYLRRAYRILPIYFVLLGVFSPRFLPLAHGRLGDTHSAVPWYAYYSFTQNIWMAVLGNTGFSAVAPTWSLAVEEQFYLTAPWILRKLNPWVLPKVLLGVIAAVPMFRIFLYFATSHNGIACYASMPCRADALSLGILSAWVMRNQKSLDFVFRHRSKLRVVLFVLLAGAVALTPWGAPHGALMATVGYTWLALFYTSLLLVVVTGTGRHIRSILCSRGLVRLGTVSYFVYLFHGPFMEITRRSLGLHLASDPIAASFVGGFVGIGLTLVTAELSWRYFEKPLVTCAHRYRY